MVFFVDMLGGAVAGPVGIAFGAAAGAGIAYKVSKECHPATFSAFTLGALTGVAGAKIGTVAADRKHAEMVKEGRETESQHRQARYREDVSVHADADLKANKERLSGFRRVIAEKEARGAAKQTFREKVAQSKANAALQKKISKGVFVLLCWKSAITIDLKYHLI